MANAQCPKCGSQQFERQQLDKVNVRGLAAVCCASCGVVVGVIDDETARLVQRLAERSGIE